VFKRWVDMQCQIIDHLPCTPLSSCLNYKNFFHSITWSLAIYVPQDAPCLFSKGKGAPTGCNTMAITLKSLVFGLSELFYCKEQFIMQLITSIPSLVVEQFCEQRLAFVFQGNLSRRDSLNRCKINPWTHIIQKTESDMHAYIKEL